MARSGKALAAVSGMLATTTLAACDSTPTQNARVKLTTTREIAARQPQPVQGDRPQLQVAGAALVRDGRASAIVVDLRSTARTPLTDVPIEVGVRAAGKTTVLNDGAGLTWFQTHVPAIAAGGTATWVFLPSKRVKIKAGADAFARVGVNTGPVRSSAEQLPQLSVRPAPGSTPDAARVLIANPSGIPQSGLQVYATARDATGYTAAGVATLAYLGKDREATATILLVGKATTPIRVDVTPTIFE